MQKQEKCEEYFNKNVRQLLQKLTYEVLKGKPERPIEFMIKWLSQCKENNSDLFDKEQNENNNKKQDQNLVYDDIIDEEEMEKIAKKKKAPPRQRNSISAEAFGKFNKPTKFVPISVFKKEDEKASIREILKKSFLFSSLQHQEIQTVVDCMKKKEVNSGEYVIRQGEAGNQLYIVSKGTLSCTKKFNPNDFNDTFLKNYNPGESFGELSLLYNVPRQASIFANQTSELWQIDRQTFNNVVKDAVIRNKSHNKELLKGVKLFQKMEESEIEKLVDSVKIQQYEQNDYVCRENQEGDCLYIVDSGSLVAEKRVNGQFQNVFEYKSGMYFGEIALICKTARKASIKCCEKTVVLAVGKNQFDRLIGVDKNMLNDFSKYEGLKLN